MDNAHHYHYRIYLVSERNPDPGPDVRYRYHVSWCSNAIDGTVDTFQEGVPRPPRGDMYSDWFVDQENTFNAPVRINVYSGTESGPIPPQYRELIQQLCSTNAEKDVIPCTPAVDRSSRGAASPRRR